MLSPKLALQGGGVKSVECFNITYVISSQY